MTICPIAIVVGCKKCPAFKICPAKTLLGDMPKTPEPQAGIKKASKPRSTAPRQKSARK